ncbi:peptidoglycan editing factor PgeF [Rhodocaloribacter sp.]
MNRPTLLRPAVFAGVPGLAVAFTTRHGGVSEPPYASLNLSLSTGDDAARVRENRRRLAEALGFAPDALAVAGQVHGAKVRAVDTPGLYSGFDGLVTAAPGVLLCITAADCAAVLLADAEAGVVGACHAGWRGAAARIVPETVAAMTALGASPARMRAFVGPCISAKHFEVGPEVAERFAPAFVRRFPEKDKPHVDLKTALAAQLTGAGLPSDAVEVSPHCTFAETRDFFSHRAEGGVTGRMMGVIGFRGG